MDLDEKVLTKFLNSLGIWSQFAVIGGGYAPIIYKLYLCPERVDATPVQTHDIDTLLSRKTPEIARQNIRTHLKKAGFQWNTKSRDTPPVESYKKEIEGIEIEVEFLTDRMVRGNKYRNVEIAGVVAQPLSFIELSLEKTIPFQTASGANGLVVSPGAWIFHKGMTFPLRANSFKVKKFKDLYGIWFVATQLGSLSVMAISELKALASERSAWYKKRFKRNLEEWVSKATAADWVLLEAQDPSRKLMRSDFRQLIQQIACSN